MARNDALAQWTDRTPIGRSPPRLTGGACHRATGSAAVIMVVPSQSSTGSGRRWNSR